MNIHRLTEAPGMELTAALCRFEEQFTYPLGSGRSFRISHGDDYPRFFRAMGEGVCFVAEREGEVRGVLGLAVAQVLHGAGEPYPAIYLGDLKIAPSARGGRALPKMAAAASAWCSTRANRGFGVVMDGTAMTPDRYTGRLGLPHFQATAQITVLRFPAKPTASQPHGWVVDEKTIAAVLSRFPTDGVRTDGGHPLLRSEMPPLWLLDPGGEACGRLEDTRRAKRLIALDGEEMTAAHLSCVCYVNSKGLARLIRTACGFAAARGFPALFVAVPAGEATELLDELAEPDVVSAPATVYATGFEPGRPWFINTAEI